MMRHVACGVVALALAGPAAGQEFRATHGLDSAAYQRWFDQAVRDGYRPVYVNGYDAGGAAAYAAVAVRDPNGPGWLARHGLTADQYRAASAAAVADGYRPASVSGYLDGAATKFAAVFVKGPAGDWTVHHNITAAEYQTAVTAAKRKGFRPHTITGHGDGRGGYRFTTLFGPDEGLPWEARHGLTAADYQRLVTDLGRDGYRPTTATAYPTPNGPRFAAAFVKDRKGWAARHNLTADEYQAEFNRQVKNGYRPVAVTGYLLEGGGGEGGAAATPEEAFDRAVTRFMEERSIPAGALAVSRGGKTILSRGYGFADREKTRPVRADDPFRLASVVKPITAAAVRKLAAEGRLDLDAPAFPLLGLDPLPGETPDPRLGAVTVRHLLEHRGGWDREASFDPMFRPLEIARAAGKDGPAEPADVIRYMLGRPLQFAPGARSSYSNFGYCVLGRLVEKAAGKAYTRYVRDDLLAPLMVTSVELGRSLPADRNPREPAYVDPGTGRNVVRPQGRERVPSPDGTFYLEAMDAHGGLIGSAPDLVRFLEAYWISGEPRRGGGGRSLVHFDSLPGTWTMVMQRPDGTNVAALFNQRTDPSGRDYAAIESLMRTAGAAQPAGLRYLAVFVRD